MTVLQTLRIAGKALMRNKLRSFLTTLGIIIGVGAVIAMVAIGDGAKAQVEKSFAAMGTNLLIVMSGTTTAGGAHGGFGSMPTLTWDDLAAIQREVPSVAYAAPQLRSTAQVITEEQNWTTSVTGTTPDYFVVRSWPIAAGATFSQSDIDGATKVVVLGQTVVDKLFGPDADPVGQLVRIRNIPFQVVGVLARKGQSPTGQDYDDGVVHPVDDVHDARSRAASRSTCRARSWPARARRTRPSRAQRQITRAAARAPQPAAGDRRRLLDPQPGRDGQRAAGGDQDADHAAGQHRRRVAAGGRHRHHEHHAGQRHRADARDRPAHGGRRAPLRHPDPVPGRGADAVDRGRHHRRRGRVWRSAQQLASQFTGRC